MLWVVWPRDKPAHQRPWAWRNHGRWSVRTNTSRLASYWTWPFINCLISQTKRSRFGRENVARPSIELRCQPDKGPSDLWFLIIFFRNHQDDGKALQHCFSWILRLNPFGRLLQQDSTQITTVAGHGFCTDFDLPFSQRRSFYPHWAAIAGYAPKAPNWAGANVQSLAMKVSFLCERWLGKKESNHEAPWA